MAGQVDQRQEVRTAPSGLSSGSAGHAWPLPGWVRFYGATSTPYSLHIVHVSRQWGVVAADPAWLAEPRTRLAVCRKRLSAPDLEGLQVGGPLATLVMGGRGGAELGEWLGLPCSVM